jgi:hypothetical protein
MLVYSYAELDPATVEHWKSSAEAQADLDDFLYLGHQHVEPAREPYHRAAARFGFTAHSCCILALPSTNSASDDFEIYRSFHTRYYLMVVVAIFYRAILLDFKERSAFVSRRLLQDQQQGRLQQASITLVNELRADLLIFSSYWHFEDLTCKQTDNDLFRRLCTEYATDKQKRALENELAQMSEFVYNYYQLRNTDAVNRLAVLSLIFGGGAVLTGFFGMNFGREFEQIIFQGHGATPTLHYFLVALVAVVVFGSLGLGYFIVFRNWRDYLNMLNPVKSRRRARLRREV